jgi:hypothetical protein
MEVMHVPFLRTAEFLRKGEQDEGNAKFSKQASCLQSGKKTCFALCK